MSLLVSLLILFSLQSHSQDSSLIKVQFIYGSKPLKKYKKLEKKWFGGIPGGHVGIESDSGKFYSFEIHGKQKIFNGKSNNSIFKITNAKEFWNIMETDGDSVKKATIIIPVSFQQKQKLDSIAEAYHQKVPYCYALFGMRCASSTYDMLAQIGILPRYSRFKTYMKIFYPRRLRKRLLRKAEENNWMVIRKEGTERRKWERDVR